MDLQALNRNIRLHERLDRAYDMVESLKEKADIQAPKLDGLPRGTDVSDKVGNIAIAIADLEARIIALEDEVYTNDEAIRQYANSFEDERVQMSIQMRFISCFTWGQVAELLGQDMNEDWIKKMTYRQVLSREVPEDIDRPREAPASP